MIFADGVRKCGFFDKNVFRQALETIQEFDELEEEDRQKFPPEFREELQECLRKE
jgi:hypothetical protein